MLRYIGNCHPVFLAIHLNNFGLCDKRLSNSNLFELERLLLISIQVFNYFIEYLNYKMFFSNCQYA